MIKTASFSLIAVSIVAIMRCSGGSDSTVSQPTDEDKMTVNIVEIDSDTFKGLRFYYPPTTSIGLIVGEEPDTSNFYISFCCAAAYTDKSIYQHQGHAKHTDVAGDHIEGGELYRGYVDDSINTGGFVVYPYPNYHWEIINRQEFKHRIYSETKPFTAFQQELLILDGEIQEFNRPNRPGFYRALCNFHGRLCIVDGTYNLLLSSFRDLLYVIGIEDALYLDMGDWSYSWYREYPKDLDFEWGSAKIVNPKPRNGYYGSNWLVFYLTN